MHMADALISPATGGAMWAMTGTVAIYCSAKIKDKLDDRKIPLMGVLGAFVFAAQMINFAIPATGSSGHLGGGLLLAILLGPSAAFLSLASVLTVQALFFADGGLLALGCNIFNLGFFPCFIAYPLIYRKIIGQNLTAGRLLFGAIAAAIVGLQLGSLGVVSQTFLSGIIPLSFSSFLLLMQAIHLPIGVIEGIATAGIISFIWKTRPEILENGGVTKPLGRLPLRGLLTGLAITTLLTSTVFVWFVSTRPDGLEWSLSRAIAPTAQHSAEKVPAPAIQKIQEKTALLPDYKFPGQIPEQTAGSLAGLIGGLLVLLFGLITTIALKKCTGATPRAGK
ncbi:MAG: energy-coupling factor ABC transporter permease [Thermodesulfobacteriota bacterium]